MRSQDVILTLSRLIRLHGKPAFVRSDNGAEFTADKVTRWLRDNAVDPASIAPGSPWQNLWRDLLAVCNSISRA